MDVCSREEFDRHRDRAGLREHQPDQDQDLHGSGLQGRPAREQYADESARESDQPDRAGLVQPWYQSVDRGVVEDQQARGAAGDPSRANR